MNHRNFNVKLRAALHDKVILPKTRSPAHDGSNLLVYFCKGSKASANALPIWAKIFALPK